MTTNKHSLEYRHVPVMLEEVVSLCSPKNGGFFLDCTFGGGNISKELLSFPNTKVIAIDRDDFVIEYAQNLKKKFPKRFRFFNKKFSDLDNITQEKFDCVIFDLGVSSFQLKNMSRGFSFNSKDKLDMSMGLNSLSAEKALNFLDEKILRNILKILGDEQDASKIAKNIVQSRNLKKIENTQDLVKIIKKSKKKNFNTKINVSTKTFQAIRIFVNKEITELVNGITKATKKLKPNGKLIIITFHSLEDKIVKFFFKNFSKNKSISSRYHPSDEKQFYLFNDYKNRIIRPNDNEILINPSSRSAKLRFATRNKEDFFVPKDLFEKFNYILELERTHV
jgi:16S rRNA (cytosine1402-N4)-methyltransferase